MSFFTSYEMLPEDSILSLPIHFAADQKKQKVNLGIGSYKDENGKPLVLACVRRAEELLFDKNLNKEYLPIEGNASFISEIGKLAFGSISEQLITGELGIVQSIGGTGALRLGGELLGRNRKMLMFLPEPTWPNHKRVFTYSGIETKSYPYFDKEKNELDFSGMCEAIVNMPASSVILLHACCHNPTGIDPTPEQWHELSSLIKKQKVLPFFDSAYQGFGVGVEEDAYGMRYFAEQGHEMLISISCSKNFGLYGERVGAFGIITKDSETTLRSLSHIKQIARASYSTPPLQGARIVSTILQNADLKQEWELELAKMRTRILTMRKDLVKGLQEINVNKDIRFFEKQKGIFSFTGLTVAQVQTMKKKFGIYMLENGRINIAGLNEGNIRYVINAIADVLSQ